MSLRDQLLAKGLVSKKQARKSDQQKRKDRKAAKGNKKRKAVLAAEEAAQRQTDRDQRDAHKRQERVKREAQRAAYERVLRVQQILRGNRVRVGGPLQFHHRSLDGVALHRLKVNEAQARGLRNGDLAIAGQRIGDKAIIAVVPRAAAERLAAIAPEAILHFYPDNKGVSSPEFGIPSRDWEPDLRARKHSSRADGK